MTNLAIVYEDVVKNLEVPGEGFIGILLGY